MICFQICLTAGTHLGSALIRSHRHGIHSRSESYFVMKVFFEIEMIRHLQIATPADSVWLKKILHLKVLRRQKITVLQSGPSTLRTSLKMEITVVTLIITIIQTRYRIVKRTSSSASLTARGTI